MANYIYSHHYKGRRTDLSRWNRYKPSNQLNYILVSRSFVPSPRRIRCVLSDLLDAQVVIDAPAKQKAWMASGRTFDSYNKSLREYDIGSPFSELAPKAAALVPAPRSLAEARLRAVHPNASRVDLL